jgi:hypothetical protein
VDDRVRRLVGVHDAPGALLGDDEARAGGVAEQEPVDRSEAARASGGEGRDQGEGDELAHLLEVRRDRDLGAIAAGPAEVDRTDGLRDERNEHGTGDRDGEHDGDHTPPHGLRAGEHEQDDQRQQEGQ